MIIGVFLGVVLEYFIDVSLISSLERENRILRDKLTQYHMKHDKVEVIDLPQADRTYHQPF